MTDARTILGMRGAGVAALATLLTATAARQAIAEFNAPLGPNEVLLFADDGTGFNPFTNAFNNWSFNPNAGVWDVNVQTNAVSQFPNYIKPKAANDVT